MLLLLALRRTATLAKETAALTHMLPIKMCTTCPATNMPAAHKANKEPAVCASNLQWCRVGCADAQGAGH